MGEAGEEKAKGGMGRRERLSSSYDSSYNSYSRDSGDEDDNANKMSKRTARGYK